MSKLSDEDAGKQVRITNILHIVYLAADTDVAALPNLASHASVRLSFE